MTKFLTAMTIIGLFAITSHARFGDLEELAKAITQYRQVLQEMDVIYNKGQIKGNLDLLKNTNVRVSETLKYCLVIEAKIKVKSEDIVLRKQEARDRNIEKAASLIDTNASDEVRAAQLEFVRNMETTKYCLGLTSQLHTSIRASMSVSQ